MWVLSHQHFFLVGHNVSSHCYLRAWIFCLQYGLKLLVVTLSHNLKLGDGIKGWTPLKDLQVDKSTHFIVFSNTFSDSCNENIYLH